jgi:AcrR family transcriptional regulator
MARSGKRDELIGIAAQVVASRGLDGTRLGDVAASAGLTTPALYTHFGSRDEMLEAVVERTAAEYAEDMRLTDDPAATVEQRLRVRFARWTGQDATRLQILSYAVMAMQDSPQVAAAVHRAQSAWDEFVHDVLGSGRGRGEIRADIDIDAAANLLSACVFGVQSAVAAGLLSSALGPALEDLLLMFLRYLGAPQDSVDRGP